MTGTALAPIPPPIPDDLDAVLRRMRFPYLRKAAPGILATARAQRWDPAEVVRILLEEEIRGRDEAGRRIRRKAAGLPAGKTFASWREADSSIPLPAQHALLASAVGRLPSPRSGVKEQARPLLALLQRKVHRYLH